MATPISAFPVAGFEGSRELLVTAHEEELPRG